MYIISIDRLIKGGEVINEWDAIYYRLQEGKIDFVKYEMKNVGRQRPIHVWIKDEDRNYVSMVFKLCDLAESIFDVNKTFNSKIYD